MHKSAGRSINGVLLLDKPLGMSSNGALQQAKRSYQAKKAGHTGTLDPLATGLLPLCFGEATKFAQALLDAPKRYTATVRFGITTTTADAEGAVLTTREVAFDRDDLVRTLRDFTGSLLQVPPVYSALKYQGRAYYEYARAGTDVPRVAREVEVRTLRLLDWTAPDAIVDVVCSKGTYVRVLAEDIGERLGCGAHLAALRRTGSGVFSVTNAVTLDALAAMTDQARLAALLPPDALLAAMPRLDLDAEVEDAIVSGRRPALDVTEGRYRAYGGGKGFLGLVEAQAGTLRAVRLTMDACVRPDASEHATE